MKITGNVKELTVSQRKLSEAIGITPTRVNQLIDEGVVIRDDKDKTGGVLLFESVKNYYSSKNKSDGVDFWKEKGLHERVKRQLAELKLQKEEGKLYDAKTVELAMIEQLTMLKTRLYGIPNKLAPQLEGKNKGQIYEILEKEIEDNLKEMSKYNPNMFEEEVEDNGSSDL